MFRIALGGGGLWPSGAVRPHCRYGHPDRHRHSRGRLLRRHGRRACPRLHAAGGALDLILGQWRRTFAHLCDRRARNRERNHRRPLSRGRILPYSDAACPPRQRPLVAAQSPVNTSTTTLAHAPRGTPHGRATLFARRSGRDDRPALPRLAGAACARRAPLRPPLVRRPRHRWAREARREARRRSRSPARDRSCLAPELQSTLAPGDAKVERLRARRHPVRDDYWPLGRSRYAPPAGDRSDDRAGGRVAPREGPHRGPGASPGRYRRARKRSLPRLAGDEHAPPGSRSAQPRPRGRLRGGRPPLAHGPRGGRGAGQRPPRPLDAAPGASIRTARRSLPPPLRARGRTSASA